jgi:Ca2+-binding EF-hand superfamily protein
MKKLLGVVIAASLMITGLSMAAEEGGEGPGGKKRGKGRMDHRKMLLEKFDADGDGKLSEEERAKARAEFTKKHPELHAKMIEKFDKDGDGKLNEEERKAAHEAMKERAKGRGKGRGKEIELTEEQRAEVKKHLLEKFDTDKDGKLSEEETKAAREELRKHMMKMRAAMIVLGGQGRGKGPMNPEMRKKLLEKFDVDKDGKLNEEERKAARKAFKERMKDRRGNKGKGKRKDGAGEKPQPELDEPDF